MEAHSISHPPNGQVHLGRRRWTWSLRGNVGSPLPQEDGPEQFCGSPDPFCFFGLSPCPKPTVNYKKYCQILIWPFREPELPKRANWAGGEGVAQAAPDLFRETKCCGRLGKKEWASTGYQLLPASKFPRKKLELLTTCQSQVALP